MSEGAHQRACRPLALHVLDLSACAAAPPPSLPLSPSPPRRLLSTLSPSTVRFASARLQRSGRCHESEVLKALGRELPRYRSLDSQTLRQLVRNWAPEADRSSQGFYKGLSLLPGGGGAMQPAAASAEASKDADTMRLP